MDSYKIPRVLYSVTVPSLSAGATLNLDETGSGTPPGGTLTSYMNKGPGIPTTSNLGRVVAGEIWMIEIIPPLNSNLVPEDVTEIWLTVDGTPYQKYLNIHGTGTCLFYPVRDRVYGGHRNQVALGKPFWKVALSGLGGHKSNSMPIDSTTIKYNNRLGLNIKTVNGFTGAGNGGLTVRLIGFYYQPGDLTYLYPGWQNTIQVQTVARDFLGLPPLNTTYVPPATLDLDSWRQLPGGTGQTGGPIINPYVHSSWNALATTLGQRYVMSQFNSLGGKSGQVLDEFSDLGVEFAGTNHALLVRDWGVTVLSRPANLGRIGWVIDGTEVPQGLGSSLAGIPVTDSYNDYSFGDTGPYSGDEGTGTGFSNKYKPIPQMPGEALLLYGQNAAPFIADNGSAVIPAAAVVTAYQGVLIENAAPAPPSAAASA
jgi:hypothetical protein